MLPSSSESFPGSEVVGALACPPPVRSWRSQNARPIRYSHRCPHPGTRLPGRSSPEVQLTFTVLPDPSAPGLSARSASRGVSFPSAHEAGRVHVRRLATSVPPAVPTPPATVPLAGFLGLSAACSSPRRPAIFRRVALLGFTLQGFVHSPCEAPPVLHRRRALLTFCPVGCAVPPELLVFRAFVLAGIDPHLRVVLPPR